jgi:hypothetical protein
LEKRKIANALRTKVLKLAVLLAQYEYNSTLGSYRDSTVHVKVKHFQQAMSVIRKHAVYKASQDSSDRQNLNNGQQMQEGKEQKKTRGYMEDRFG